MSAPPSCADCPFCAIASAYPPSTPSSLIPPTTTSPPNPTSFRPTLLRSQPHQTTPTSANTALDKPPLAHILLSTPHLLAFLDHAPISRGHVLVATRSHREKLGNVSVKEASEVGKWLGVVSRAVMGGVTAGEGDWNVVQNNGARAAQVVPHVHFHIIPRVGDVPEVKARSWTVFGKGQREDLDEADAEGLIARMREALGKEVERVRMREGEGAMRELLGHDGGGGGSKL